MPKLAPQDLRRFFAFALPACALTFLAQRLVLAQRPSNALPPSYRPAPTDEYHRGEAPYPTVTPSAYPTATATPGGAPPDAYDPYPQGAPQPTATARSTPRPDSSGDSALSAFLSTEAGGAPLKLSQARGGWKSIRIVRASSDLGAPGAAPRPSTFGVGKVQWSAIVERFSGAPGVFLTRGRTLKLNGDDQLLVYQAQFPSVDEASRWLRSQVPDTGPERPQIPSSEVTRAMRSYLGAIPLRASLINTRQVAAMEDIEPFDFQARFAALSRDLEESFRQPPARPDAPSSDNPDGPRIVPPARIPNRGTVPPSTSGDSEPSRAVPVPDAVAQQAASEPLRRLFAAVQRYRADNADVLPAMDDLQKAQAALAPYLSGLESWRDPVSGRFFLPNARLSGRRMVHIKPFASSLILIYSEPDASGARTVLRLDGIVRRVSATEWDKLNGTAGVQ